MLRSMTGFGVAETEQQGYKVSVELRSVNHRFLDISMRLPRTLNRFEDAIKSRVRERIERGRVSLSLTFESQGDLEEIHVNEQLVSAYLKGAKHVAAEIGIADNILTQSGTAGPVLATILGQPEVMERRLQAFDDDMIRGLLLTCLDKAIDQANEMKTREGKALGGDLVDRLDMLSQSLTKVEKRAPSVPQESKEALQARLKTLLEGKEIDEQRLAQEVAIMADRSDITEECVRLHSHLKQFHGTIESPKQGARRMGFLVQEMHREVNTIGSKTNQLEVTDEVLLMKEEIEKIREQIQNLE